MVAAAKPNADGCPPAKAEKAPPPLVLAAAGVPLEAEADGFANAENAPPVGAAVELNADVVAGFPNELWPNED